MEICRCEEYKRVVENFKFFICGTIHHLEERDKVPDNYAIKWVKTKTSYENPRFIKPILVRTKICECTKEDVKPKVELETKWIPVLPGLISQKIVNQDKSLNRLLV